MIKLKSIILLMLVLGLMVLSGCAESNKSSTSNAGETTVTYTVTFNGNDAESGSMDTISAKNMQQVELPANTFVKTGYKFTGWAETADGKVVYPDTSYITVTKNIILYAVWEKIDDTAVTVYTVTLNSGYDDKKEVFSVNAYEIYTLPDSFFQRDGYILAGWSLSEGGDICYKNNDTFTINNDIILYAVWQSESAVLEKYTVTFNGNSADNGNISPVEVIKGNSIILPKNTFTKIGFIFAGWSIVLGGEIVYNDMAEIKDINENITLYAVWQSESTVLEKYTVTFNGNSADKGNISPVEVIKGNSIILPKNTFTKTGFIFAGWSIVLGGEIVYHDMAEIKDINENIILYAVWQNDENYGKEFTVSFDTNGGTGGYDCRNYYETRIYGGEIFLSYTTCKKDNLVFLGWGEQADGQDILYKDGQVITVTRNMKLYAVWADRNDAFVVNIDKNSGSGFGPSYLAAKKGDSIILPAVDSWKRDNYVPTGYSDTNDAVSKVYKENEEYTPQNNITLYVVWHDGSDKLYAGQKRWVYGVNGENIQWIGSGMRYRGLWTEDANWYDTYQEYTDMCWAASSSNLILWWNNNNRAYIEKYKALGHTLPEFAYTTENGRNSIFEYFKENLVNEVNQPPVAFNYFMVGNSKYKGGAFFNDVFNGAALAETVIFADKANFNAKVKSALDTKKALTLETSTGGAHVITIWGVAYDNDGFINKLFVTDSATEHIQPAYGEPDEYGDMTEAEITYSGSSVFIEYYGYPAYNIKKMQVFSLGQDFWDTYFQNN